MKKPLYTLLQYTWGLPQTLLGSAVYLAHRKDKHGKFGNAKVTYWNRPEGLSLGKFIFVPAKGTSLLDHEYGHTIQSLILGPAYLPLVGLPSLLWNRLPYFRNKRKNTGRDYYSVIFEKTANKLGDRFKGKNR
ncbi:MAG: hypothetical protein J5961_05570 [Mogibacterium sp.]|nr:hypothetical protein [Mogibacterium sp.]